LSWCIDRHGLQAALELAQAGKVKKVLVHEVSRLARRNSIVHRFVESLEEVGVSLYRHQQGVETLLSSGNPNPAASVMLALLAEMSCTETETLWERIKTRRQGRKLGRPEGTVLDAAELLEKHKDIVQNLKAGQSVRNTAKITRKGASTVQRVKAELRARGERRRRNDHWTRKPTLGGAGFQWRPKKERLSHLEKELP
jgi:DNA invertase Pin-like site-specific DNA recombinase